LIHVVNKTSEGVIYNMKLLYIEWVSYSSVTGQSPAAALITGD